MGVDAEIPKFVKWAGGKGQLLEQFEPLFPKKITRYIEPFVGSGPVFFYVVQKFKPKEVIIADINKELIAAYKMIQKFPEELIIELKQHAEYHKVQGKKYYLTIRSTDITELPDLEIAARFIYLNRTCFNGLYRVNSKGGFNVPMGAYKNPNITQEDNIRKASKLLKGVKIKLMSFEKVISLAKKDDFVYLDPPYYPLNKSSFTTYTSNNFLEEQQNLLKEVCLKLHKKGCFVMQSNSDTEFIKELYKDEFKIHFVKASRMINRDASKRGKINEVVITNY
jgi:DNA adenine methylase